MVTAARRESLLAQLRAAGVPDAEWDLDQLFYIVLGQHYHALDPAVELSRQAEQRLCELVRRRAERQPLQYLAGEWDFYNITLKVGPGVLIPRPDTEIIVEQALRLLQNKNAPDVLDLCAGTGAIGCAVKHNRPDAKVTGVELSPQAFCYLQENAARYGVKAKLGDVRLFARDCAENSMALIVSNPPYVTQDEYKSLEPELYFEPRMALLAEDNGLDFYQVIAADYKKALLPGGWLCLEIGAKQGRDVCDILAQAGYEDIQVWPDYSGLERCITAKKAEAVNNSPMIGA